jgi:hypothetical protein
MGGRQAYRHAKAGSQRKRQECTQATTRKEAQPGRQTGKNRPEKASRQAGKQAGSQAARDRSRQAEALVQNFKGKDNKAHVGRQACCHADTGRQLGMKAGQEEAVKINLAGKGKQGRRNRQVKAARRGS